MNDLPEMHHVRIHFLFIFATYLKYSKTIKKTSIKKKGLESENDKEKKTKIIGNQVI